MDDVNPNGGGISLGHPLGATGARITATLLNELDRRDARYGIASMCVGFGMAIAGVVERAVKVVGVVGLGAMGSGIAQLAIEAGFDTVGHEVELARAEEARDRIAHFLTRKVEKGTLEQSARDDASARLRLTTELADLADCDIVIEAAFEDLAVKHELFRALEASFAPTRSSRRTPPRSR